MDRFGLVFNTTVLCLLFVAQEDKITLTASRGLLFILFISRDLFMHHPTKGTQRYLFISFTKHWLHQYITRELLAGPGARSTTPRMLFFIWLSSADDKTGNLT